MAAYVILEEFQKSFEAIWLFFDWSSSKIPIRSHRILKEFFEQMASSIGWWLSVLMAFLVQCGVLRQKRCLTHSYAGRRQHWIASGPYAEGNKFPTKTTFWRNYILQKCCTISNKASVFVECLEWHHEEFNIFIYLYFCFSYGCEVYNFWRWRGEWSYWGKK